jgi:hypothetical protein
MPKPQKVSLTHHRLQCICFNPDLFDKSIDVQEKQIAQGILVQQNKGAGKRQVDGVVDGLTR